MLSIQHDLCRIQNNWKLGTGKSQTSLSSRQLGTPTWIIRFELGVSSRQLWPLSRAPTWRSLTSSWFKLVYFRVPNFLESTLNPENARLWWQHLPTKDRRATSLFKWPQQNKMSPKRSCMLLHKLCSIPGRYVHCSQESNTKYMLCSKLLVAHVPHHNNLVPFHLII